MLKVNFQCFLKIKNNISFTEYTSFDGISYIQIKAKMRDKDKPGVIHETTIHLSMDNVTELANKIKETAVNQLLKVKG